MAEYLEVRGHIFATNSPQLSKSKQTDPEEGGRAVANDNGDSNSSPDYSCNLFVYWIFLQIRSPGDTHSE